LLTRILSALVALPLVIFLIELGGWVFGGLVGFVGGVALYEFMGMAHKSDGTSLQT
jgi:CDP-diglyceride synthetase